MIGWLDASAGASGDMLLGALVDAGVPLAVLQSTVDALGVGALTLDAGVASRHGLGASQVRVRTSSRDQPHRRLSDIRALLGAAALPEPVRELALAAFELLGAAEAAVHRIEPDRVHFHEVGALDALADVVAGCAGVHWLREQRGLTELTVSPIEAGSAAPPVPAGHGAVPVPAPAVVEIARRAGLVLTGRLPYEACTPTGAALLATLTGGQGPMPAIRPETVGLGAGGRDPAQAPNVLRLLLGSAGGGTGGIGAGGTVAGAAEEGEDAVLLECNVDDLDPRLWPAALAALLGAGASDAWLSPILMKKGRPAHTLHVLCPLQTVGAVRAAVFAHTTTIGLRETALRKHPLDRQMSTVDVDGQPVAVKLAVLDGRLVNASVEFDDVLRAAQALGRPAKAVLAQANAAAQAAVSDLHQEGE
ncbi:MAG: pyridinium-3,5-bisthiocarboxylic acid mononucleotide nickel chelatase [Micromonosporaceae bacterium]